jgi:spermidine/putrescine ABC transporter ATP-binding subunit
MDYPGKDNREIPAHVNLMGINKQFGAVKAVNDISLSIREHEFISLLGPSGSGKTTLLMIVAGFVKADSGQVLIDGRDITEVPPYQRNIGMVFQSYALFPHMTVADNVNYPLKMRRIPRIEARKMVRKILDTVQLRGFERRFPAQLSGGQQQRVALARALVFKPPILLMDEPLGALDKKLREQMQIELKHIQEQLGITILYVTHDQQEALSMSSRIAVINSGRIEHLGTAKEIYDHPTNQFVADFVGETNIFSTEVCKIQDNMLTVSGSCIIDLRTKAKKGMRIGQQVHIAVRPERVIFIENEDFNYCTYEGRVIDVIYLGDVTKYYIQLSHAPQNESEGVVIMKVQNRLGTRKHNRGDTVRIGWNELDATFV